MKHEQLTGKIIEVFYEVYNELGHGFLESVYENAMRMALIEAGLSVVAKKPVEVWFRGVVVGVFEPDVTVENLVILELKATRAIDSAHEAQLPAGDGDRGWPAIEFWPKTGIQTDGV
jgi:GxxExxY protein